MKMIGLKLFLVAFLGMYSLMSSAQSDLTVKVTNVRSAQGRVMIANKTGQYAMADAQNDTVVIKLAGVPDGKCLLMVFHDENGNYKLDKEGEIPTENCATKAIDIKKGMNETVVVKLEDLRKYIKK